jgi:hypothetical protein
VTNLKRQVQRFTPEMCGRLDDLAETAGDAIGRDVPRAALVRAAVTTLLTTADSTDSADRERVIKAIRLALVKRGKKPRS